MEQVNLESDAFISASTIIMDEKTNSENKNNVVYSRPELFY
jgi:hypothetical protein